MTSTVSSADHDDIVRGRLIERPVGTIYHRRSFVVEVRVTWSKGSGIVTTLGLSSDELQTEIARRMAALDEAQEDEEHLGAYGEMMRMVAVTAFQRAAELIALNNERIEEQLAASGIVVSAQP